VFKTPVLGGQASFDLLGALAAWILPLVHSWPKNAKICLPLATRDYTENEMLAHQTGLQQPRIALRRLFSNAGNAIRAYTPCIMMSPMSVAQYIEPGKHRFNILVIDEASQMRPEDALGAMLRCDQAVIVGDPEQLPPTDFFVASDNTSNQDVEDAPEESILELGRRCWHPMRMLEVHYRSRHHSLIAYSNREFYGERLLVYPSPVLEDPEYGVSCRKINGAYEVGQGRNLEEARSVVEEAAALMRGRIDRSIGIVAMNQAQRDLIETLIDEETAIDPDMQAYRDKWNGDLEDFSGPALSASAIFSARSWDWLAASSERSQAGHDNGGSSVVIRYGHWRTFWSQPAW